MESNITIKDLITLLSENKIVIYGTGHVSRKFLCALKKYELEKNILYFAVSPGEKINQKVEGIHVQTISSFCNQNIIVCIAVHEALRDEIICILERMNIKKYIWIYPFLYELLLGCPIKRGTEIDLKNIIQACKGTYELAVRYIAIDEYFGKNKIGYNIYKKALLLSSGKRAVDNRLQKFYDLIHNWEMFGYDSCHHIMINSKYEIVDGAHRVATARYFGQEKIMCDIFSSELSMEDLHGEGAILTESILRKGGFFDEEIELLKKVNKSLESMLSMEGIK